MSIASAHRLARLWNYDFHLIWDYGPETLFASPYEDLFKCNHPVIDDLSFNSHEIHIPQKNKSGRHFYKKPSVAKDILLQGWGHLTLCENDINRTKEDITEELRSELKMLFIPSEKVDMCCGNLGYVDQTFDFGIHVRRGSAEFDSISNVEQLMSLAIQVITRDNLNSFFIASTDHAIADYFGSKLIEYGNCFVSRSYNNQPSFRNHAIAIYDLLFFSRCQEIIKTGATTYSSLAALIGGATLNTVDENGNCYRHPALYSVGAGL
jgi:hypothetical protein